MKRKIMLEKEPWEKLKQMKGTKSYSAAIMTLINDSNNISVDADTLDRLEEIRQYNNYADINETIENMIADLEKFVGED